MLKQPGVASREFLNQHNKYDLVIVGGGLAGVCCAITAARAGIKVGLVQDRPVLGGNASSEIRLWALGATAHMGNNNRWAREGGIIDEILVENTYRNPEGNPLILDTVILEKVVNEPNITLYLNTAVIEVGKSKPDSIEYVRAFCSQNSTMYELHAPLFCDASGDGVVGFLAGAAFRMGAESEAEFGEKFAPDSEYGELLGDSLYFYTKDVGKPVRFIPPSFALKDITSIPRWRNFNTAEQGCQLWWIEYGGRLDTVHDTEKIKWELWKVVYGVWDYIKNSGEFPEAETMTLEWVGHIPGKRESRRFEGPYILKQQDVVEQREHGDAVSFGGWAIDLHPADGVFSEKPGCNQWHARGVYQIPYGCLYSKNISNLFLAGRIISTSHVAFGSSRVMATGAHTAQAVGIAAAICTSEKILPAEISQNSEYIARLQLELLKVGQNIPGIKLIDSADKAKEAKIRASSQFYLDKLEPNGSLLPLTSAWAQLLPLESGPVPNLTFELTTSQNTTVKFELRTSNRPDNYTPDVLLDSYQVELEAGENQAVKVKFKAVIDEARYVFVCLLQNPTVSVRLSEERLTGILSAANKFNPKVATAGAQVPTEDIGVESFEFWLPQRRPAGQNMAIRVEPPLNLFAPANLTNGFSRPTAGPNAWVAAKNDPLPTLTLEWDKVEQISRIDLDFDTDFDHPMESVLMTHPESAMPFCVKHFAVCDATEQTVYEEKDNHQSRRSIKFDPPLNTERLSIHLFESH